MPPDPITVTPPPSQATQATVKDVFDALDFIKAEVAKAKTGGASALLADAPQAIALATKDFADVQMAIPEIKAGLRSTEFWVPVIATILGSTYFLVTKKDIPVNLTVGITALLSIYMVARTMLKAKQVSTATPIATKTTTTAAAK